MIKNFFLIFIFIYFTYFNYSKAEWDLVVDKPDGKIKISDKSQKIILENIICVVSEIQYDKLTVGKSSKILEDRTIHCVEKNSGNYIAGTACGCYFEDDMSFYSAILYIKSKSKMHYITLSCFPKK